MMSILKNAFGVRSMLAILFVAPVLAFAIVPALRPSPSAMMARHMGSKLDDIDERLVPTQLKAIAKLDGAGVEVLVEAMGSRREIVARSAADVLHAQLHDWFQLPTDESSTRAARLAQLLAGRVDQWDETTRGTAADIAIRILHSPIDSRVVVWEDLTAHCQHVLKAAKVEQQIKPAVAASPDDPWYSTRQASHTNSTLRDPSGFLENPLSDSTGGELPIKAVQMSLMPPSLANPPVPRPLPNGEPQLVAPGAQQLPRVMFPDERPGQEPTSVFPTSPVPQQLTPEMEDDPKATELTPATASLSGEALDKLPDLDLIRRLSQTQQSELVAVEQQLRRRGFNDQQLGLAQRVADPDPVVRRQLAESLPNLASSPNRWLFWLSYDPDPLVRRIVISLMATSQDPRLHRRLREMHSLETDEVIRAQLDKLFAQQSLSG